MTADKHGQEKSQAKKRDGEPDRELLQHVGGLWSPDLAGGGIAEGSAKAFLPRALHEHDENEQKADDDFDCGEDANKNVHKRGREYGGTSRLGKGEFGGDSPFLGLQVHISGPAKGPAPASRP